MKSTKNFLTARFHSLNAFTKISASTALAITFSILVAANQDAPANLATMKGAIRIDGSSTVYPITEAVSEEFSKVAPKVNVTVGISGTGGGFKRFCRGETDVSNASRPILKEEMVLCDT